MKIKKYTVQPTSIKASRKVTRRIVRASQRGRVMAAEDEIDDTVDKSVNVNDGAEDLLFETDDVAQLVAEVTQQPVDVEVSDDGSSVDFTVGEDTFTVEPDDDTEVLECTRTHSPAIKASRRIRRRTR